MSWPLVELPTQKKESARHPGNDFVGYLEFDIERLNVDIYLAVLCGFDVNARGIRGYGDVDGRVDLDLRVVFDGIPSCVANTQRRLAERDRYQLRSSPTTSTQNRFPGSVFNQERNGKGSLLRLICQIWKDEALVMECPVDVSELRSRCRGEGVRHAA